MLLYFNECLCIFRVHVFENGTLVLYSAGDEDAGTYKCLGVSQSGRDQAFTAQLLLACKYHSLGFIYIRSERESDFFFDLCHCRCRFNVNIQLDSL